MNRFIIAHEVAAFTDEPNSGTPTGVVLNTKALAEHQMLQIARALGFSHTAFMYEDSPEISIRFFTPTREIRNCAHATIAAHYLRASQLPTQYPHSVLQKTVSGLQSVQVIYKDGVITTFFQQNEVVFSDVETVAITQLLSSLGVSERNLAQGFPIVLAAPGEKRFMVALNSETVLKGLNPDFHALKILCDLYTSIGCFVYTMRPTASYEAMGRMFAPAIGVDEDIVNGNSSGCLGAYLLKLNGIPQLQLVVHQGFTFNRPGTVFVNARQDKNIIETSIGGTAIIVREIVLPIGD